MKDRTLTVGFILLVVSIIMLAGWGMRIKVERMDTSVETVTVQVIAIDYLQETFSEHEKSIVRCRNCILIFDSLVEFPLGNVTIKLRDSWYDGEYRVLDWEWLD